jgi:hypothetical protein
VFKYYIENQKSVFLLRAFISGIILTVLTLGVGVVYLLEKPTHLIKRSTNTHYTKRNPGTSVESSALRRLCDESKEHPKILAYDEGDLERGDERAWDKAKEGVANAQRLLPAARTLTINALHMRAGEFGVQASDLQQAEDNINAVDSILLDKDLGNLAEVDEDYPREVRIGAEYALYLTADEEAILLLAHELTHVAVESDQLDPFIENIAKKAEEVANVYPTEDQKEDLACDFVGEQALEQYVTLYPANASTAERLAIGLGQDCSLGKDDDDGDEEHLSDSATLQAIFALDPELSKLILNY